MMRRSAALLVLVLPIAIGCGNRTPVEVPDDGPTDGAAAPDASARDSAGSTDGEPTPASDATLEASDSAADASPTIDAAGVGPCLAGGNIFYVEGDPDDPDYPATATIGPNDGAWSGLGSGQAYVDVSVTTAGNTEPSWAFAFSTAQAESAIAVGTYDPVTEPSGTAMTPTLELVTGGNYCNTLLGSVTIAQYETTGPTDEADLYAVTATFERHCNGSTATLRGCVHFQQ